MFDSLSTRLQDVFKTLRGESRLTPESIEAALREIRLALLEADVNFKVVKAFVDRVRDRAMGQDVLRSLSPSHQVVKIVRDEMVALFGETDGGLKPSNRRPRVILLLGLQGAAEHASRAASEAVRRNADAFSNTWRTIVTSGMQNVSGEWMRFMQNRVEENLKRFDEMMSCRTVHDCFAIQAQIARDNCEALLQTARLTSELSTNLADDAVKQMSDAALAPR